MKITKRNFALACTILLILTGMAGCGGSGSAGASSAALTALTESAATTASTGATVSAPPESSATVNAAAATSTSTDSASAATLSATADVPSNVAAEPSDTVLSDAASPDVDVDLTALSGIMVYSEVYNMLVEPEDYLGKTVKMNGFYTAYHNTTTDEYYFACIIQDATACCAQGLEFQLTDAYSFPGDYPAEGDDITVVGVFDTYMEDNYPYYFLRDARLV